MRVLIATTLIFLSFCGTSQTEFLPGYYVNNEGNKIECLIKNQDWKTNPTKISVKNSANQEKSEVSIDEIKEFTISNISKYIRSTTNIDRSTNNINKINDVKRAVFEKETLFLKAIIEGQADLFMYGDENLIRYFYRLNEDEFSQLVYKRYRTGRAVGENNQFRQQLTNTLNCATNKAEDFDKIRYSKSSLVNVFMKYNRCVGGGLYNYDANVKKDLFKMAIKIGVGISSLDFSHNLIREAFTEFPGKQTFTFGVEAEMIFPFANNKWSIVADPSFTEFSSTQSNRGQDVTVNYVAIDLPIGLRYSYFITQKNRLFLTTSYSMNTAVDSGFDYRGFVVDGLSPRFSPTFSLGYKKKDAMSIEFNYVAKRDLFSQTSDWKLFYRRIGISFGYSIK